MWCKQCRQDVPGMASRDEEEEFCCPRCGGRLGVLSAGAGLDPHQAPGRPGTGEAITDPPYDDGWEMDQQLEHIQRVLHSRQRGSGRSHSAGRQEVVRLDPAHCGPAACHLPSSGKSARKQKPSSPRSSSALGVLTWGALSLGTTAFVCGGILLGWSFAAGREELWDLGLPIALGGQIGLLIGLVLQLDRLWHDSRQAAAKLDQVDEQLHELKTTATMLGTSHYSAAGAFYSHLSHGASPQLLLSDLKSQLDLLAVRIGQEKSSSD